MDQMDQEAQEVKRSRRFSTSQSVGKKWTRSSSGWLGGVCGGLAKTLDMNPTVFRLFWFFATAFFGLTVFMYIVLWAVMPREDRQYDPDTKIVFGVCLNISQRTGIEVSWIRAIAVLSPIPTLGTTLIIYLALALFLPSKSAVN